MTESTTKITPALRLGSMLLDHAITCFALVIVLLPFLLFSIFKGFTGTASTEILTPAFSGDLLLMSAVFAIYYCKDSIDGRSMAKRITKLQVVDARSGATAGAIRCCIRNLTIPIWPLEVLITLFSPTRRLGDFIAGTKTVAFDNAKDKMPANWANIIVAFLIGFAFTVLLFYGMFRII